MFKHQPVVWISRREKGWNRVTRTRLLRWLGPPQHWIALNYIAMDCIALDCIEIKTLTTEISS